MHTRKVEQKKSATNSITNLKEKIKEKTKTLEGSESYAENINGNAN